jgi:hypothetical protein
MLVAKVDSSSPVRMFRANKREREKKNENGAKETAENVYK